MISPKGIVLLVFFPLILMAQSSHDWLLKAEKSYFKGQYEQSIEQCNKALKIDRKYSEAYRRRGWSYFKIKNYRKAKKSFDKAIKYGKSNASAYQGRATVLYHQKRYRKALKDCAKALKLKPDFAFAYITISLCKWDLHEWEAARKAIDKAIELDSKNKVAHNNSGALYKARNNFKKAESAFTRALKIDSNYSYARLGRAEVRLKLRKYQGALNDADWAVAHEKNNPESYRFRAEALLELGQPVQAEKAIHHALKLKPGDDQSKKLRDEILRKKHSKKKTVKQGGKKQKKNVSPIEKKTQPVTFKSTPAPMVPPVVPELVKQDLPKVAFNFRDPCDPVEHDTSHVWAETQTTTPSEVSGEQGLLPPYEELRKWSTLQYNGMISMVMESMRLIYGPLTPEENTHFETSWAPFFDYPSKNALNYLNELYPLITQFLAGRETLMRALASFQVTQFEAVLAIASDNPRAFEMIMNSAVAQKDEITALQNGLRLIASRITELGTPPNPRAEQCEVRRRYRKHFPKMNAKPYKGLEGEWVGYTMSDEPNQFMPKTPLHYFFQYHMIQNPFKDEPWEVLWGVSLAPQGGIYQGYIGANELHWTQEMVDNRDGNHIEYDYGNAEHTYHLVMDRVEDDLPACYEGFRPKDAENLKNRAVKMRKDWYDHHKIIMTEEDAATPNDDDIVHRVPVSEESDEDQEDAPVSGPGRMVKNGITYYHNMNIFGDDELKLGLKLSDISRFEDLINDYNRTRGVFHTACQNWRTNPPVDETNSDKLVKIFRKRLLEVYMVRQEAIKQASESIAESEQKGGAAQPVVKGPSPEELLALQETIDEHLALVALIDRNITKVKAELYAENDVKRRDQLAFNLIQLLSNRQAEQDLADSYKSGVLIHRRTAFDAFAHQQFIKATEKRALKADAVRRTKRGLERMVRLLPEDQRSAMRKKIRRLTAPDKMAMDDIGKARRLAAAVHNKVAGYWEHEHAVAQESIINSEENEFYAQMAVMVAGTLTIGAGTAAFAEAFGETAAVTAWAPHLIGGIYGAATGYVIGGPGGAVKHSLAWVSPYGFMATQFVEGWEDASRNPQAGWQEKMWEGTKKAGVAFVLGKAMEMSAKMVAEGSLMFLGKDSMLFKPIFRTGTANAPNIIDAARTQQEVDDVTHYIGVYRQKRVEYLKAQSELPAGSPDLVRLESELSEMTASLNSSFHGKRLLKYREEPELSAFFDRKINEIYDDMIPEMNQILKEKGYEVEKLAFKKFRNASSSGSASMDLDYGIEATPGLVIRKNGKIVSMETLQKDGQAAMNVAYHRRTGYSATRSEVNFTTPAHDEAFSDVRLLKHDVNFSDIDPKDIAQVGTVIENKVAKVAKDPILSPIGKIQSSCRESSKEIKNMLLKKLNQELQTATPGSPQAKQLEADIRYWEDMLKRFTEIGTKETDPFKIMQLERDIRMETGGKGSREVIQDLVSMFRKAA